MEFRKNIALSDPRFDTIAALVRVSYPYSCVLWMEEINNRHLTAQFNELCLECSTIKTLFHGTKSICVDSITSIGFRKANNRTSALGIGTYFSPNCSMSMGYTDPVPRDGLSYVFLCDVLIGRATIGVNNVAIDRTKYDCAVNSLTSPTIYCIPDDQAILPKTLVVFHKNPR
jgi:Poly(ADP-ribose) polymerase catalytic domain